MNRAITYILPLAVVATYAIMMAQTFGHEGNDMVAAFYQSVMIFMALLIAAIVCTSVKEHRKYAPGLWISFILLGIVAYPIFNMLSD
jgi:hypothetical protein